LVIFSSAYFAYKKFDLSIKTIYKILDTVVPLIYTYDFKDVVSIGDNSYVLNDDYANMIIDLKDGTKMTIREYFKKFNILKNINKNSKVKFKNGDEFTGNDYLDNLIKYVSKYNNYDDLYNDLVESIE
jgi:hypothetical protein